MICVQLSDREALSSTGPDLSVNQLIATSGRNNTLMLGSLYEKLKLTDIATEIISKHTTVFKRTKEMPARLEKMQARGWW